MKIATQVLRTAVVVLCVASSAACAPTRKMVVECEFPNMLNPMAAPTGPALVAQEYGKNSPIPLNAVQFTSASLKKTLVVQMLNATRTETNTAQVYARLINCTDEPMQLGMRTTFMGTNQAPVEPVSAWKNVWVQPAATGNYYENSISRKADYYLVEIRDDTQH